MLFSVGAKCLTDDLVDDVGRDADGGAALYKSFICHTR